MSARHFLAQSPHKASGPPEGAEYVGRCQTCRRCFCWPNTPNTRGVVDTGRNEVRYFNCPVCARGPVIQTTRMAHGPWHHLYEHQAANLQQQGR